jgi:N-methylhydantoinase B
VSRAFDATALTVFDALFSSVAEEMGLTLGRTAFSPNIKERHDFSCAVFDPHGRLVAQAAHIPVHLGAMPQAVAAALPLGPFAPGDLILLNDPYLGGTHLPDITMVSPVFDGAALAGFVASRAHHADVGGVSPGSMPIAPDLYGEGLVIPPLLIKRRGRLNREALKLILRNVRTPDERLGDLRAQMAAHMTGTRRLLDIVRRYGRREVERRMVELMDYAERLTRAALRNIPEGVYTFEDVLDDDGAGNEDLPVCVRVTVRHGAIRCDFSGSAREVATSLNAVEAVTRSAVYYVIRCLAGDDVPANEGCFRPVEVVAPAGTIVNARPPRAVSAGNVETSQRIVDAVLGALARALPDRIPAASCGSMNNVTIGGWDRQRNAPFAYYETIAGGAGAGPRREGLSAVHTHMTNTMNTPVEALELAYPFRVVEYAIRRGSGGAGLHRGGDGVVRTYEFQEAATVTLVTERRRRPPWGLRGGGPAEPGQNLLVTSDGGQMTLPGKTSIRVRPGDRVRIETPGGGGWGMPGASL